MKKEAFIKIQYLFMIKLLERLGIIITIIIIVNIIIIIILLLR